MNTSSPQLKSLVISLEKGKSLFFKIHLPPNLATVAPKDKIMVKVEAVADGQAILPEKLDRGRAYAPEAPHLLVAMLLESWCEGTLHGMLCLSREQLKALLTPLEGEATIYFINAPTKPLEWGGGCLPRVHEHLTLDSKPPQEAPTAKENKPLEPKRSQVTHDVGHPMLVDGSTNFLAITLPSKESIIYSEVLNLLRDEQFRNEPSNGKWWLRDRHKTLVFLAEYYDLLKERYLAQFTQNFQERTAQICFAKIQTEAREVSNGYELEMRLCAEGATEADIRSAIASSKPYLQARKGALVLLKTSMLKQLAEAQKELSGQADRAFAPHFKQQIRVRDIPMVDDALGDLSSSMNAPETWRHRSNALKRYDSLEKPPVGQAMQGTLRPYQLIGVAWMWHLYTNQLSGILADEMGLGKTLQAIALLQCISQEQTEPMLVICPASLLENWKRECQRFAPMLEVYVHHGQKRTTATETLEQQQIILTSYGTMSNDIDLLHPLSLACVIIDEAQQVKNRNTQNAKALRRLKAHGRFALSGTPIENSVEDLRSLFEFLMPGYISKTAGSMKKDERQWYAERHIQQAAPYILRRKKASVAPELPDKIEQTLYCTMDNIQAQIYAETESKLQQEIKDMEQSGASEGKVKFAMFKHMLRLRQICAEPRLLKPELSAENSCKWQSFYNVLQNAIENESRILLFSQFTQALGLLRTELEQSGTTYAYLDGKTPPKDRLAICDRFNQDTSIPVFLISLKAGGTGLNLTGADTVVHLDPWWNAAAEAQATDRAHRIGQTRTVTSIKLITANTIEERVLQLQRSKAKLLNDLLDASDANAEQLSLRDWKGLLGISAQAHPQ